MGRIIKLPDKRLTLNTVYCADNLAIMKTLPNECLDLCYIDPPFNTRSVQKSKAWDQKVQEIQYYDSYGNGIMSYVAFMKDRLQQIYRLLKDSGSLFVHVDYRSVHYLKIELDKIFGLGNMDRGSKHLINEIIWYYGGNSVPSNFLPRKHDSILWYVKNIKKYTFNKIYVPYSESTIKRYNHKDKDGNKYKISTLNGKTEKVYMKEGNLLQSVWTDIHVVRKKEERIGYPTQKPLSLLERIIKATTNKNDIVADFFCGCGTALSAAQSLNRHWIGIDASKEAVKVIRQRMEKEHNHKINESTLEKATLKNVFSMGHKEFEIEMVQSLGGIPNKKGGTDNGIDGVMADTGEPIQVKQFIPSRSEFDKFYKHLKKNGQGSYIAYDFTSGIKEEVMRLKNEEGIECRLYTVGDLLGIPSKQYKEKLKKYLKTSSKKAA